MGHTGHTSSGLSLQAKDLERKRKARKISQSKLSFAEDEDEDDQVTTPLAHYGLLLAHGGAGFALGTSSKRRLLVD